MNWKGCGRKCSCSNLKYYSGMSGGTEEYYKASKDMNSDTPKDEALVLSTSL